MRRQQFLHRTDGDTIVLQTKQCGSGMEGGRERQAGPVSCDTFVVMGDSTQSGEVRMSLG